MKRIKSLVKRAFPAVLTIVSMTVTASADNLSNSTVGTGIKNMLSDLSGFLIIICPILAGAAAVYCLSRRSMADEQDGKMWIRRVWIAIFCGVGGCLVSGIMALISSYFM